MVIAAVDGRADVLESVRAVRQQDTSPRLEVILAANAGHPGLAVARALGQVVVIESAEPRLVPELWGLGVAASRGSVIAITMSGCVPGPAWVEAVRRAHVAPAAAIGGPIEQQAPATAGDWALYFARYAPYMSPLPCPGVVEVPGDNGSYKRRAIAEDLIDIGRLGFWETEINARLRRRGSELAMSEDLIVWHTHSFGVAAFSRQRWQHGRLHGRNLAKRATVPVRIVRACAAPLAWSSMMVRLMRTVARNGRHVSEFVRALPLVGWFYACWIAGEAAGLLAGDRSS